MVRFACNGFTAFSLVFVNVVEFNNSRIVQLHSKGWLVRLEVKFHWTLANAHISANVNTLQIYGINEGDTTKLIIYPEVFDTL